MRVLSIAGDTGFESVEQVCPTIEEGADLVWTTSFRSLEEGVTKEAKEGLRCFH